MATPEGPWKLIEAHKPHDGSTDGNKAYLAFLPAGVRVSSKSLSPSPSIVIKEDAHAATHFVECEIQLACFVHERAVLVHQEEAGRGTHAALSTCELMRMS